MATHIRQQIEDGLAALISADPAFAGRVQTVKPEDGAALTSADLPVVYVSYVAEMLEDETITRVRTQARRFRFSINVINQSDDQQILKSYLNEATAKIEELIWPNGQPQTLGGCASRVQLASQTVCGRLEISGKDDLFNGQFGAMFDVLAFTREGQPRQHA